eukprot:7373952-Ditylum_brightwellii.AAC.1
MSNLTLNEEINQLWTAFEKSKVERGMFTIDAIHPNFVCGGLDHYCDRYSSYFGRHHIYRKCMGYFSTRQTATCVIDAE